MSVILDRTLFISKLYKRQQFWNLYDSLPSVHFFSYMYSQLKSSGTVYIPSRDSPNIVINFIFPFICIKWGLLFVICCSMCSDKYIESFIHHSSTIWNHPSFILHFLMFPFYSQPLAPAPTPKDRWSVFHINVILQCVQLNLSSSMWQNAYRIHTYCYLNWKIILFNFWATFHCTEVPQFIWIFICKSHLDYFEFLSIINKPAKNPHTSSVNILNSLV